MTQTNKIGKVATNVITASGYTCVIYHSTTVVKFSYDKKEIILNSGGWHTYTTKMRMNQAANQFGLDFVVFQRKHEWFVCYGFKKDYMTHTMGWTKEVEFKDGMKLVKDKYEKTQVDYSDCYRYCG